MAMYGSWEDARDRLRKLREEQTRRSDEVVELWEDVLAGVSYKLGSEVWAINEQVCVAACDCGRLDIAEDCLNALKRQFPNSSRIDWLKGLVLEARGEFNRALQLYDNMLKKDDTNALACKRKIAILKAQKNTREAITLLTQYLQNHMTDMEAWLELCELYLQELDYQKAAFCLEEVLLSNPYNHLLHQKYAEIRYTWGGTENMELAKKYFGQALKLNPNNMRALYGFFLASNHLAQSQKGSGSGGKTKKDNAEYANAAWRQIVAKYESKTQFESKQLNSVKGLFETLQITASPSP